MAQPHVVDSFLVALDLTPGAYRWCVCGRCSDQPFADPAGCQNGFAAVEFQVDQPKRFKLCQCKHSKKPPYCDSSHSAL